MAAISFASALGIHEQALYLRSHRAEVLGNNLANVDTPNFKARDVDFSALLDQAGSQSMGKPQRTDARHMTLAANDGDGDLLYTTPSQPSIDGNTVEEHREMARFAKNSMDYEASLYFLNAKFKGLQTAISGQ
ncbi:MAG: flgB [Verrucomicrobiaceae bacterium]|nr:flgB [Verrucomicrobiaceae bacterium]